MNTFQTTIQQIENGTLAQDLAEKFSDLIGKVKERGKAGSLTLSLKVKPLDSDGESVALIPIVKIVEPAKAERQTIFFTTDDNRLERNNPAQTEMKLEAVPKAAAPLEPVSKAS